MAYNDYGAFVWHNGERRRDKEDSGVFDSDESDLAPAVKIYANLIKLDKDWDKPWPHLKHGVMGDGDVRVSCFKTCFPCICHCHGTLEEVEESERQVLEGSKVKVSVFERKEDR